MKCSVISSRKAKAKIRSIGDGRKECLGKIKGSGNRKRWRESSVCDAGLTTSKGEEGEKKVEISASDCSDIWESLRRPTGVSQLTGWPGCVGPPCHAQSLPGAPVSEGWGWNCRDSKEVTASLSVTRTLFSRFLKEGLRCAPPWWPQMVYKMRQSEKNKELSETKRNDYWS